MGECEIFSYSSISSSGICGCFPNGLAEEQQQKAPAANKQK